MPGNLHETLDEMVRKGHLEEALDENGTSFYRLTKAGEESAVAVLRRNGLDPTNLKPEQLDWLLGLRPGSTASNMEKRKKEPKRSPVFND